MIASCLCVALCGSTLVDTGVSALFITTRAEETGTLFNKSSYVRDEVIWDSVKLIEEYWALEYPNHDMKAIHTESYYENVEYLEEMGGIWQYKIRLQINATYQLSTSPESHPYLQGMRLALSNMSEEEYAIAIHKVEEYEKTLESSYLHTKDIAVMYTLVYRFPYDPSLEVGEIPEATIYRHTTKQDYVTALPYLGGYATGLARYQQQVQEGELALWQYLWGVQGLALPTRTASYNIERAVSYAIDHAWDVPQYSSANGLGSDCANFLSHCLLQGGITEDYEGKWYPSSSWGSYGSSNWIRTGFTPSVGGVVLYMRNRNLFYQQSNPIIVSAGSILFHKNNSHVALVTYSDGEIMTYVDHSNSAKEYKSYMWEAGYVDYYAPSPYILSS